MVKTLFEAIMLVFLVMYLFLQNMRATLIPHHCGTRGVIRDVCHPRRLVTPSTH
ncbi:efflux RND transporter permease subunit [Escherichia coli]